MQTVILVGKIIRKRDFDKVTYITIACKEGKAETEFIPVTVFQTDFLNKFFHEGKWIGIRGHIHINKHNNEYVTEIIADDLFFIGDKPQENQGKNDFMSFEDLPGELPWDSL